MIWLNEENGANVIELEYATKCLTEFDGQLYGGIMGSAYGGALEVIGKLWKGRGIFYGFDTFEGHPKFLSEDQYERDCMDIHYQRYGREKLTEEYQRVELDRQGLINVILKKGLVSPDSCRDIPYLNYIFLDMDIPASMEEGYKAVKDKVVKNGYALFHDVAGNIRNLVKWFEPIINDPIWKVVYNGGHLIVVLQKQ